MRIATLLLATATLFAQALAWGEVGHRTVAYIAYKLLTGPSQRYVDSILNYSDGRDISDGAVWPDHVRHFYPFTSMWHFIGN